eukprot:g3474.t1
MNFAAPSAPPRALLSADTSRGHNLVVKNVNFQLPLHYNRLKYRGGGSYGMVVRARNTKTGSKVAIKRMGGVFHHAEDAKRMLREIKLLKHLGSHANIVRMTDTFHGWAEADTNFNTVYVVTPLWDTDLHGIIKSPQPLSAAHARYFTYQLLRGLKYVHSADIIHRDLKPANVLIKADCSLALCDFGLARGVNEAVVRNSNNALELTAGNNVVTRWYRAPELLMNAVHYGKPVDLWSVGCILAEVLGRGVMFRGASYIHQLQLIVQQCGTPSREVLTAMMADLPDQERAQYQAAINQCGFCDPAPAQIRTRLLSRFPNAEPEAVDLLNRLLAFDPSKRITVDEALAHPWLNEYHATSSEPSCERPFDFSWEAQYDLSDKQTLRKLFVHEMANFQQQSMAEA